MENFILAEDGDSTTELYKVILNCKDSKPGAHLAFLAPPRIRNIKSVLKDPEKLKDIEELQKIWKDILIDAIFFLRINDRREKAFFEDDEKKTTMHTNGAEEGAKANVYGIDELNSYFKMFTEFEHTLYGADKYYRDHLIHPIMVWIIGLNILVKFGHYFNLRVCNHAKAKKGRHANDLKTVIKNKQSNISELRISTAELSAMWAIIALTHDLGYPLEKVEKINDQLEKMLSQFGKIGFSRSRFNFETQHDHLVRFLLSFISSVAIPIDNEFGGTYINKKKEEDEEDKREKKYRWINHKRTKYFTKFSKSWVMFDHGIVSSLILLKALTYFIESDHSSDYLEKLKDEDARQFSVRSEILHTVATHTTPKIYHLSTNNLPFLLILCDDLQEWSRPTLSDLRAGIKGSASKVMIEKLEIGSDSSSIHCIIKYKNNNSSYKSQNNFVKRIFKTWAERFRPALDDVNRSIIFIWEIKFGGAPAWSFEFNTNNTDTVLEPFITKGPKKNTSTSSSKFDLYSE